MTVQLYNLLLLLSFCIPYCKNGTFGTADSDYFIKVQTITSSTSTVENWPLKAIFCNAEDLEYIICSDLYFLFCRSDRSISFTHCINGICNTIVAQPSSIDASMILIGMQIYCHTVWQNCFVEKLHYFLQCIHVHVLWVAVINLAVVVILVLLWTTVLEPEVM